MHEGIVCLGSVVEDHWVAVAVWKAYLGDLVVVAVYLPPSNRGGGKVAYCKYWAGKRWDIDYNFAVALRSPALSFWVT